MAEQTRKDFEPICDDVGLKLERLESSIIDNRTGQYASLYLDRFLPESFRQILYVDADVQYWKSIERILTAAVPAGRFLASADPMMFRLYSHGARPATLLSYMQGLGLKTVAPPQYFNSGVLRINRHGWNDLGMEALAFLKKWPEACLFDDQSALNAVSSGRHQAMSLRWNFPVFFRNLSLERLIEPSIYHFMSQPKPWQGSFPPWNRTFSQPYPEIVRLYPHLAPYLHKLSYWRTKRYLVQQHAKKFREIFLSPVKLREHIKSYEAGLVLP